MTAPTCGARLVRLNVGRHSLALSDDEARAAIESLQQQLAPDRKEIECDACKRPEGAANHVPGHIFVGWGTGWQVCGKCLGSQRVIEVKK